MFLSVCRHHGLEEQLLVLLSVVDFDCCRNLKLAPVRIRRLDI